jgi:NAD(P)-dependent dehydrogenase (short-subunit alcohol dehydrogenase family)
VATVLIIGASRGIGLEIVKAALQAGHSVRALARSARRIPADHPKLEKMAGELLLGYNVDRAQIMSGLCRSFHPTGIDTHSVGRISKTCRPLYGAESEMTHDADRNYREAGGKKYLHTSSTALL